MYECFWQVGQKNSLSQILHPKFWQRWVGKRPRLMEESVCDELNTVISIKMKDAMSQGTVYVL